MRSEPWLSAEQVLNEDGDGAATLDLKTFTLTTCLPQVQAESGLEDS